MEQVKDKGKQTNKSLSLKPIYKKVYDKGIEIEEIRRGKKSDGINYTLRLDRRRYFFPDEWNNFISLFKNKLHKFLFITALHTGGRIMEILNLKYEDIDTERQTVTFKIVKQRKAKRNFYAVGKQRSFFVASNFISEYKSFIRNRKINLKDYIFLDNSKLPSDYDSLTNDKKKKYYVSRYITYSNMFKSKLKKSGVTDYRNFSIHNIRKTYGNWMRTFNLEMAELCYRMGHDMDTFIAHYGSSLIFTDSERRKIMKIMGEVK